MKKPRNPSQEKAPPAHISSSPPRRNSLKVTEIQINSISVEERKRVLSFEKVDDIKQSLERSDLIQPIMVTSSGRLVAGLHRLEAFKRLGRKTIPAVVVEDNKLLNELREIDENLVRSPLTALERGEHHRRAKEIIDTRLNVEGDGRNNFAETSHYTQDAAERLNLSRRSIQQEIRIATLLNQEIRDLIRETPVSDRKNDLLNLTRLPQEQQIALALIIQAGAKTLSAALRAYAEREDAKIGPFTIASEEATCIRSILKLASSGISLEDIPDAKEAEAMVEKYRGMSINIRRTLSSIMMHYDSDDAHLHIISRGCGTVGGEETGVSEIGTTGIPLEEAVTSQEDEDKETLAEILPLFQAHPTS